VALNTSYINALLEDSDVPLEFIDGYIRELSVTVPMANLLKDNCLFEINGLTLTLQVAKKSDIAMSSGTDVMILKIFFAFFVQNNVCYLYIWIITLIAKKNENHRKL
jgi:hypothetical protein